MVTNFDSTLLEIVEIHQIDLQHDDDIVGSASSLLQLLEPESVADLRVTELSRKTLRTIIIAVDD